MRKLLSSLLFVAFAASITNAVSQSPAVQPAVAKNDAEIAAESKQAEALYQAGKTLDSLPLYEDLHAQRPAEAKYTELLAMAYVAKAGAEASAEAAVAEETEGLKGFLTVVRSLKIPEEKYDATVRSLMALERDGMIECWILLDNPDNGTAQDYAAFRATHRELLKSYVEKYDLRPA